MVTESRCEGPGCHRCLVYVLFVWVTILSLGLCVALSLLLSAPQPSPSPTVQNMPFSHVPNQEVFMETRNSNRRKAVLSWAPGDIVTGDEPLSIQQGRLVVKEGWEGFYFLYIQVALQSTDPTDVAPTVRVKQGYRTLLESVLTRRNTGGPFSTGFLGRQVVLHSGKNITVSCSNPSYINTTDTATYLGVYLLKQLPQ